jgi:hypothetical protein
MQAEVRLRLLTDSLMGSATAWQVDFVQKDDLDLVPAGLQGR